MVKHTLCILMLLFVVLSATAQLIVPDPAKYKSAVEPLLKTIWSQKAPYNEQCPTKTASDGVAQHCPVGCVALALAQIMKYYNYPETGQGTKSYTPLLSKETLSADFGATHYDWKHMKDSYFSFGSYKNYTDEEASAVATLCYQIGVSVGMMYALSGSSAFAYGNIPHDIVDNFRYDADSIKYLSRSDYSKEAWMGLIYHELTQGRPVFYAGNSPTQGGHAWVIDGYNAQGQVHINWGWSGTDNGYYDIDLTDTSNDFINNQSMIIGMMPPKTSTGVLIPTRGVLRLNGIYSLDGRKLEKAQRGLNIMKYSDGTVRKVIVK